MKKSQKQSRSRKSGSAAVAARAPGAGRPSHTLAAIDIGSNAVRFALAELTSGGALKIVEERRRPTRLGANLAARGKLPKEGAKATIAAVKEFCFDAARHGVLAMRLVATAAVREAPDGAAFVARLERETGMRVSIIGTDEEARLAFRSCTDAIDLSKRHAAIVDIGGGSVQISLSHKGTLYESVSLPLGAVRLTSMFGGAIRIHQPATEKKVRKHVRSVLAKSLPVPPSEVDLLVGCGGTFASLLSMLTNSPRSGAGTRGGSTSLKPRACTRDEFETLGETLKDMNLVERERWLTRLKIPADRADILPAGIIVAEEIIAALRVRTIAPHGGGVRDGLLRELAMMSRVPAYLPSAARRIAMDAGYENDHSEHVASLALALLSDLADVDRVRDALKGELEVPEILESAGVLHDVGVPIDYDRHHKVARRIIELAWFPGASPRLRAIIANIARYHRKSLPAPDHAAFTTLARRDQGIVRALAGVLRVADGLDRTHTGSVHGVRVRITRTLIEITAEGAKSGDANIKAAQKKSDLLAAITRRKVLVKSEDRSKQSPPQGAKTGDRGTAKSRESEPGRPRPGGTRVRSR
ncbi:MAG: Ppx/GppA family phosphatase [Phycisphaerales bacterium]|nr:Ppx/GppA family phosphatase [Phycisphaerales bacterium]